MGKRGPQGKSPEVKQLEGVRSDRINAVAPIPAKGWPSPPAGIAYDSLVVWEQLKVDMEGTGHIRQVDRDILRAYCDLVVKARNLQSMYEGMGPVTEVRKACNDCDHEDCPGYWVEKYVTNPIALQLRDTLNQLRIYARELGASPSARSDIKDPGRQPTKPDHSGDFF